MRRIYKKAIQELFETSDILKIEKLSVYKLLIKAYSLTIQHIFFTSSYNSSSTTFSTQSILFNICWLENIHLCDIFVVEQIATKIKSHKNTEWA